MRRHVDCRQRHKCLAIYDTKTYERNTVPAKGDSRLVYDHKFAIYGRLRQCKWPLTVVYDCRNLPPGKQSVRLYAVVSSVAYNSSIENY